MKEKPILIVDEFINSIEEEEKKEDAQHLLKMMQRISGEEPYMWAESIIAFGTVPFTYASGEIKDWFLVGFAVRKSNITIYILDGFDEYQDLLSDLGPHRVGKSCLYIRNLQSINEDTLEEMISRSVNHFERLNKDVDGG